MATRRRDFLRSTGLTAAAGFARAAKPSETVRVAIVGLRGRGRDLIGSFHALNAQNVQIATFCDCDENVLAERASAYEKLSGRKLSTCSDMRRVFDDKSIDAVGFATPNHWHALGAIWALQAGKHVYVEKPGSHTFHEGQKLVEAAARYRRVVQHGTQNRSSPNIVEGVRKLKEGVIGRVYMARGIAYKKRNSVGRIVDGPAPSGLNWDLWSGPAPLRPYAARRHRGWHMLFDYGNGDIGNQGVHELDIIRWALDLDSHPTKIAAMGGRYAATGPDGQDYPHIHSTMYEWKGRDVLVTFETRSGWTNSEGGMGVEYPFLDKRNAVGVIFIGTDGYMIIPDYSSYYTFLGEKAEPGPSSSAAGSMTPVQAVPRRRGPSNAGAGDIANQPHFDNFVQAIRAGNPASANAPVKELHLSSALPHFANIAWRTGRMLHFDAKREQFTADEEANRLLKREYRAPFALPERV